MHCDMFYGTTFTVEALDITVVPTRGGKTLLLINVSQPK